MHAGLTNEHHTWWCNTYEAVALLPANDIRVSHTLGSKVVEGFREDAVYWTLG